MAWGAGRSPDTFVARTTAAMPPVDRDPMGRPEVAAAYVDAVRECLRHGPRGAQVDTALMASAWQFDPTRHQHPGAPLAWRAGRRCAGRDGTMDGPDRSNLPCPVLPRRGTHLTDREPRRRHPPLADRWLTLPAPNASPPGIAARVCAGDSGLPWVSHAQRDQPHELFRLLNLWCRNLGDRCVIACSILLRALRRFATTCPDIAGPTELDTAISEGAPVGLSCQAGHPHGLGHSHFHSDPHRREFGQHPRHLRAVRTLQPSLRSAVTKDIVTVT